MSEESESVKLKRVSEAKTESATFIEGLPGNGLVAAITVDQMVRQLNLTHFGSLQSDQFPRVTSFKDGRIHDPIRLHSGSEPPVITLQSDMILPPSNFLELGNCLQTELATEVDRGLFIVGAPAESEDEIGQIQGMASTDGLQAELRGANIPLADGSGLVGGVTGALAKGFYEGGIPTAVLIVKTNPFFPDPTAAQSLIENAIEPMVDFDIETTELEQQADAIEDELEQIADHYQQIVQEQQDTAQSPMPNMYQ
ncbi:proteasome assembly chaperone family protein [Haladaptatus caseinilyticus]|uniref:proteasome assembly chaperone family protein n=1 Tax=Haladaptatus caseinilyticus TaxID=2993314 RepID=UPI00224A95B4|nr:PAC2 family protein [Haladaptatus caseinilyticus]